MLAPPSTAAKPCKHGHTSPRGAFGHCLECHRQRSKKQRKEKPAEVLLRQARYRAKKDGNAHTITLADVVIPELCPLLGIKLKRGNGLGGSQPSSPTLDRIIPALGYVRGNVWVISHRANTLKNNATLEELQQLVNNLTKVVRTYPWERT